MKPIESITGIESNQKVFDAQPMNYSGCMILMCWERGYMNADYLIDYQSNPKWMRIVSTFFRL